MFEIAGIRRSAASERIQTRKLTDKLCLVIFLVCIGAYALIAEKVFQSGDIKRLITPVDSDGRNCGVKNKGADLTEYPYLYIIQQDNNENPLSHRICVKQCPGFVNQTLECFSNSKVQDCGTKTFYKSVPFGGMLCVPSNPETYKALSFKYYGYNLGTFISALITYKYIILASIVITIGFSLFYSILLHRFAMLLVVSSFLGVFINIGFLGHMTYRRGEKMLADVVDYPYDTERLTSAANSYISFGQMIWAFDGLLFFITLLLFKRIRAAVSLLSQAGKFVSEVSSSFATVFIGLILAAVALGLTSVVAFSALTSSNLTMSEFSVFPGLDLSSHSRKMTYFLVFMAFWIFAICYTLIKFSISTSVCLWTYNELSNGLSITFRSLYWTFRYHFGTVVLSSLVLGLAGSLKFVAGYIARKVPTGSTMTSPHWLLTKCLICVAELATRALKLFNEQAITEVVLSSTSYCTSAKKVVSMFNLEAFRFDAICSILLLAGKLVVASAVTITSSKLIDLQNKQTESKIHNQISAYTKPITLAVIFCLSWVVSAFFSFLLESASNTLMTLQLIDHHRGTNNKNSEEMKTIIEEYSFTSETS